MRIREDKITEVMEEQMKVSPPMQNFKEVFIKILGD
jgi:hypothetical protein